MLARARWLRLRSGGYILRCLARDGGATLATVRRGAVGWEWLVGAAQGTAKRRCAGMRAARAKLTEQEKVAVQ